MKNYNTEISNDYDMSGKFGHIRVKKEEKVTGHHCKVEVNKVVADKQKRSAIKTLQRTYTAKRNQKLRLRRKREKSKTVSEDKHTATHQKSKYRC